MIMYVFITIHVEFGDILKWYISCCCCLPTPMALASGGSPMFPLVVHQPASLSIWPAVQSLRRGLSTNPGATMWLGAVEEMMCVVCVDVTEGA